MFGRKKNQNAPRKTDPRDTGQYRDVHSTQQTERSEIGHEKSMTSRIVLNVFLTVLVFLGLYFFISVVAFLIGAFNQFVGKAADDTVKPAVVETVQPGGDDAEATGPKRIDEAPLDVDYQTFLDEYFTVSEDSTGAVTRYEDAEGNTYTEPDIVQLLPRVQSGELLSERGRTLMEIERLRAESDGPLPLSMAPMNITKDAFYRLYFTRGSTAAVAFYYDSEGNKYTEVQVDRYYEQVRKGLAGSGENSDIPELGGSGWDDMYESESGGDVVNGTVSRTLVSYLWPLDFGRARLAGLLSLVFFLFMMVYMKKNLSAQNLLEDVIDINQYPNDQHIAMPWEIQEQFDWFPDVGAHCPVQANSMISHMALSNKGLDSVQVIRRAAKDVVGKDGEVELYAGDVVMDDNDEPVVDVLPMIDEKFMDALFTASDVPKDSKLLGLFRKRPPLRVRFDPTRVKYNPGNQNRDKLKDADTLADMINKYWVMPDFEPQRPGGAYLVDTQPVNTMVLAITRAGKGQSYIEPVLDMWTRETQPNNAVINDPKGELLVKFYVRGTVRGFQIVQFNLINAMKTDIYNPLGMAADAARENDFIKCAQYVENIADVFFPLDGSDDPVWPNAANNAFKRAAYGLIDYYLEEEKAMRRLAERVSMDPKILEARLDEMWGKVTLYNCYQLFVQLTAKKEKNPAAVFTQKAKNGDFDPPGTKGHEAGGSEPLTDEEYMKRLRQVEKDAELWEESGDKDLLTLFFNATAALPRNQMRTLINNADNALRSMAGAEKMLASVYGIAITAMSFFTDPTISTLTSGRPSQNVDLGGLGFPRRFGVRFNPDFVRKYHLMGMQAKWMSFEDKDFTRELGEDFYHEDLVTREGWARYYFKGKYEKDTSYIRLQIMNPQTGMLIRTFYFEFRKSYQMSLDARYYITDPVLGDKIVKNGILTELRQFKTPDGRVVYRKARSTFTQEKIRDVLDHKPGERPEKVETNAIVMNMVRYSEKPKLVFLVTPPHLMKYAKLILILIQQLVNLNFDQAYMTKSDQKPLYKTRFMLDELGNLQSEGHGIANFQTMLSIGLGQDQQFSATSCALKRCAA